MRGNKKVTRLEARYLERQCLHQQLNRIFLSANTYQINSEQQLGGDDEETTCGFTGNNNMRPSELLYWHVPFINKINKNV